MTRPNPALALLATALLGQPALANPTPPEFVELQTNLGTIAVRLDYANAPISANNFIQYVQSGFYRHTLIHRAVNGPIFIIQGGGHNLADGRLKPTRPPIVLESDNGLDNVAGTIAMARTHVPDSATAQFYINVNNNPGLDYQSSANPGYAVFGRVVRGLNVATRIMNLPTVSSVPFTNAAGLVFIEAAYATRTQDPAVSRTRVLLHGSGRVSSAPAGIDCPNRCAMAQATGAALSLTATPAAGHVFTGWRGDCAGLNRVLAVNTRTGNHNCTATFGRR